MIINIILDDNTKAHKIE